MTFETPSSLSGSASQHAADLVKSGYTRIEDVVARDVIDLARAEFSDRFPDTEEAMDELLRKDPQAPVVKVGDKRYSVAVPLSGAFAHADLYANPAILEIARATLGDKLILDSFQVVVSLPGSEDQHIHSDGHLFHRKIDAILPAFAVSVLIPLIDMNAVTGVTRIWPRTHRSMPKVETLDDDDADNIRISPEIGVGSCAIWDYRVRHSGQANTSDHSRPALIMTYCKQWYRDVVNHGRKVRVNADSEFLKAVPSHASELFRFVGPQHQF